MSRVGALVNRQNAKLSLASLPAIVLLGGCSLILDFSPSDDATPVEYDAAGPPVRCTEGEPNEDFAQAVTATDSIEAAICEAGDLDFWSFEVDGAMDVVATATFTAGGDPSDTDLEMQLVDSTGAVLTVSTGVDGDERIEQSAALSNRLLAGTYAAVVLGRDGTGENDYDLTVEITTPAAAPANQR